MSNVTEAVRAEELLGDGVGSTRSSWIPVDSLAGLVNLTVTLSGGRGNISGVSHGSGTETWDAMSPTTVEMVYDRHVPLYPQVTLVTLCVVLGCVIVATVLGNVFVITAILVERSLHGVSNYLILSLAVTDLLVAVLDMPLSLLNEVSVYWYLGRTLCDMWVSVDVLCCTASILHLVAIAMDRFWAVSKIDYVRRRCARQILLMIALVWLVSVAISIPPLFGWRHESDNPELSGVCMISQDHGYTIFSTVGAFYCPLVLMLVLNFKIYRAARFRIRRKGFAQPVARKSRRTGHVTVPVVQVEQETTVRDAMRNSSGSDISQDGMSMFNPSCLVNNDLSRNHVDLDSNTGDYDNNYSYYGGESSDSKQNDSCYQPLATEDPDCPPSSPCLMLVPVPPAAAKADADGRPCVGSGTACDLRQTTSLCPPTSAPSSTKTETDRAYLLPDPNCETRRLNSVALTPTVVGTKRDTSCIDTCGSCVRRQMNSVSPASNTAETAAVQLCMKAGARCGDHQLISLDPIPRSFDADTDRSFIESCASCGHQLNSTNHTSPGVETQAGELCMETGEQCGRAQLSVTDPVPPATGTAADKLCVDICGSCGHHELTSINPALPFAEAEEPLCLESGVNCCHHRQLLSADRSPPADSDFTAGRSCLERGSPGYPQLTSADGSVPTSRLTEPGPHQRVEPLLHHHPHSPSDVNPCVSSEGDLLAARGSNHLDVAGPQLADGSFPIQITVQGCESSVRESNLVQCDSAVGSDEDAGVAEASKSFGCAEEEEADREALLGESLDESLPDKHDDDVVDVSAAGLCPSNSLSVDSNCVASGHSPQHQHHLQQNHVAAAAESATTAVAAQQTLGTACNNQLHPGANCLHLPKTHNCSTATTATTTTTTSLSGEAGGGGSGGGGGGQQAGNQLKVPPLSSVHTRQPSKSRANNNTKRARNREKEKQRREKLEMRRERKAARVLGIITGAFVVCWLPFFLLALLGPFLPIAHAVPPVLMSLFLWLGYFNSLLNPIIYTIFNPSFRKAFRKIFFKRLSSLTR